MVKKKHLDGRGKGEFTYDYKYDILMFKTKDRDYQKSIEFGNLIVDIDTEGYIAGIRIFDASQVLKIPKIALKEIKQFEFNTSVKDNIITVQLRFTAVMRNKPIIQQGQDFVREVPNFKMADSEAVCSIS